MPSIIKEIAKLFPSSKIHLGGDEAVIEKNWTKCDRCQSLMKQLQYTKESQLMNYFFDKILASVRKYGNSLIMAPGEYTYLDYPQLKGDLPEFNNWGMPAATKINYLPNRDVSTLSYFLLL